MAFSRLVVSFVAAFIHIETLSSMFTKIYSSYYHHAQNGITHLQLYFSTSPVPFVRKDKLVNDFRNVPSARP